MWERFWQDTVRNLGPVYFCLSIVFVVTAIFHRWLYAKRELRATYVLSDGGLNAVRVTLDAQLSPAERRRILSAYGAVLSTYAPAFDSNSAFDVRPNAEVHGPPAMTTPEERTRAVLETRQLLIDLANPAQTPNVPEALRQRAETLLRYYSEFADMNISHRACPHWFVVPKEHSVARFPRRLAALKQ